MKDGRDRVEAALVAIEPWDDLETSHRDDALAWVRRGAPIWRTAKPATPPKHLCSYAVLVDVRAHRCLLVDHLLAGLRLPPGGHVEPGEDPATTAPREVDEELGIQVSPLDGIESPLLVTQTTTVGADAGHCDVTLWYACSTPISIAVSTSFWRASPTARAIARSAIPALPPDSRRHDDRHSQGVPDRLVWAEPSRWVLRPVS